MQNSVTVSIVSHGHKEYFLPLLKELARCGNIGKIILTLNIPESLPNDIESLCQNLMVLKNDKPKGFAANHNAAFQHCNTDLFCVLNPDISLLNDPFECLQENMLDRKIGVIAPSISNPSGTTEVTARRYPTPYSIFLKALKLSPDEGPAFSFKSKLSYPDWIGGMFMLFRSDAYRKIGGFDERYFLYYEDVDICARLWINGYLVAFTGYCRAIHDAQKQSHRDVRFLKLHIFSMLRFFLSPVRYRAIKKKMALLSALPF